MNQPRHFGGQGPQPGAGIPHLQLPESADSLQSLLEAIPIPMLLVRQQDSEILFVNRRVEEFLDAPAATVVGRHTTEFYLNLDDRQRLAELLEKQGAVHDFEVRSKGPNGNLYWVAVSIQSLIYRGERCFLGGLVDLTRRKEAEASFAKERRLLTRLLQLHERDRQLIGFELHDGVVQDMTAAVMFMESALHDIGKLNVSVPESLEQSLHILRGALDEARRFIGELQPPVLEEAGLVAAIELLIQEVEAKSGLVVQLRHDVPSRRLAPALEMATYRIVQESLNNVWRHSHSATAEVVIIQKGNGLEIRVNDAGTGFDPNKVSKKRYGLVGIRERARLLGGSATLDSAVGKGTRITVELPLTDLLLPDLNSDAGPSVPFDH